MLTLFQEPKKSRINAAGYAVFCLLAFCYGAPAGIRTPTNRLWDGWRGINKAETKRDNPVFTESAAVKVSYVLLRLCTSSRRNHAILVATETFHAIASPAQC